MWRKRGPAITLILLLAVLASGPGGSITALAAGEGRTLRMESDTELVMEVRAESGSRSWLYSCDRIGLWADITGRRLHCTEEHAEGGQSTDRLLRLVDGRLYTELNGKGRWSPVPADFDRQLSGLSPSLLSVMDGESLVRKAGELGYTCSEQDGLVVLEGALPDDDPVVQELLSLLPAGAEEREVMESAVLLTVDGTTGRLTTVDREITVRSSSSGAGETVIRMTQRITLGYEASFPPL